MKQRPYDRGKGRFLLEDTVEWDGSKYLHKGIVVEVVKYGMYPTITRPPAEYPVVTWPELSGCHCYREHESYVVEDASGKRWWPRVGNLRLVERNNEYCKEG